MDYLISQVSSSVNQPDFWRDGIWQFIGVIISIVFGVAGLALTALIFIKQIQRKSLVFEVLNRSQILKVVADFKDDLEIRFKGNLVENLTLIVIKFFNAGNVPIEQRDYAGDIVISFGDQAEILSVDILEQIPKNLGIALKHDKRYINIQPILMNKEDPFTMQILVSKYDSPSINGRISGVKQILKVNSQDGIRAKSMVILAMASLSLILISTSILNDSLLPKNLLVGIMSSMVAAIIADLGSQSQRILKNKVK